MKRSLVEEFETIIRLMQRFLKPVCPVRIVRYPVMVSEIEAFISRGQQLLFPTHARATLLRALYEAGKADQAVLDLIFAIFADISAIKFFIGDRSSFPEVVTKSIGTLADSVTYSITRGSIEHLFNNLNIGLKHADPDVLRRYAHNNHLLAQLLRDPDLLIGETRDLLELNKNGMRLNVILEPLSETTTKIGDMTVEFQNPLTFAVTMGSRSIQIPMPVGTTIRTSFDSKVIKNAAQLLRNKTVEQQMQLIMSDRVQQIVIPMLQSLNLTPDLSGANLEEAKRLALQKYIPIAFRHYVYVPQNLNIKQEIVEEFHTAVDSRIPSEILHLMKPYGTELENDVPLVEEAILAFLDVFIGEGHFINNASSMTLPQP